MPDWEALRLRFPVFEHKTYINSCSYGALSVDVKLAIEQYLDDRLAQGCNWDYWVDRNEALRDAMAGLINADRSEVAVTTSASAGLNAIASALDFNGGRNRVIISDYEFPTDAQIWYAQERRGAEVIRVTERDSYIPVEAFEEVIDERTLIVSIAQVCFRHGARLDVPAIAAIARERGALVLMDGYQGLGTLPFDSQEAGVDFVVGGNLKYLLGTAGVAFLYVRKELLPDLVPTVTGWFAAEDIHAMDITGYRPAVDARKFESGTPPIVNIYAALAGLKIIEEVGLTEIHGRIGKLTEQIKSLAHEKGYMVVTPTNPSSHGPMIALRCRDVNGVVANLSERDIVTSCRDENLRISPHFYNNPDDVEMLFSALHHLHHLIN